MKKLSFIVCMLMLLAALTGCGGAAGASDGYRGIDVASPDWVGKLDAAGSAEQMLIVAAFNEDATDAWISLHEKQSDGSWRMVMTTPGFIGKNGLGKRRKATPKRRRACFTSTGRSVSPTIRAARSPT